MPRKTGAFLWSLFGVLLGREESCCQMIGKGGRELRRIMVFLVVIMSLFTTCVYTVPAVHAEEVNLADTVAETATVNVDSGLPVVSQDQIAGKANNMAMSVHKLAMKVSPQISIVVFIGSALLGTFIKEARKMIIFVMIGLALVYWAPMIISLWTSFLQ